RFHATAFLKTIGGPSSAPPVVVRLERRSNLVRLVAEGWSARWALMLPSVTIRRLVRGIPHIRRSATDAVVCKVKGYTVYPVYIVFRREEGGAVFSAVHPSRCHRRLRALA